MFAGELVGGGGALILWRDISSHIWKCLVGKRGLEKGNILKPCILAVKEAHERGLENGKHKDVLYLLISVQVCWAGRQRGLVMRRGKSSAKSTNVDPKKSRQDAFLKHSVVAPKLAAQSTTHMPA